MSEIISHHHFMFPFRWDILPIGFTIHDVKENEPFDQRTDLSFFKDEFGPWERKPFILSDNVNGNNYSNYSEFVYYHQHVQKAIYDYQYPWKNNQILLKYFEYNIDKSLTNLYIIKDKGGKTYELKLDGITLHLFATGVGILSYNLTNCDETQKSPEDILKINGIGRRIYPQFLGPNGVQDTKNAFLPDSVKLIINEIKVIEERFEDYKLEISNPTIFPSFISDVLPENFICKIGEKVSTNKRVLIVRVTDDRMFVVSWYGNDKISLSIKKKFRITNKLDNKLLYAFIFGDNKTCTSVANKKMYLSQLDECSYQRWVENGTVFGVTSDSFVCLTDESPFCFNILRQHVQSIYYTMSILCLAQRTSILKFTAEISNLADIAKLQKDEKLMTNIKDIYKNYIEFTNKLYFMEVTSLTQGIELYDMIQEQMNIKEEINFLKNEINELNQYVTLLQDEVRNKEAAWLNRVAAFFLPASIFFTIVGAGFITNNNFDRSRGIEWDIMVWILIGFIPSIFFYLYIKFKK